MFTTGSKYFFGIAAFALIAALFYGGSTAGHEVNMATLLGVVTLGYKGTVGDHYGYAVLMSLFATSVFLGCMSLAFRDADAEAEAQLLHLDQAPVASVPQGTSYWPVAGAFGAGSVALGLVVGAPLVIFGALVMAAAAFEWATRAWSERATGDPAVNRAIRNRVMQPIEIPVAAVLGVAVFVLAISRLLIALPKSGSYVIFAVVPAVILLVGWLITVRPKPSANTVAILVLIAAVAVLAAGVIGAAMGPRDIEKHSEEEGAALVVGHSAPVTIRGDR